MEIVFDIFNYVLVAIMIGVSGAWIALIRSMIITFQKSPFLDKFSAKQHLNPKVSVILPARNEEKFIKKCLDSLLNQDYENYEIMAIDDSSEDSTGKIIEEYSKKDSKIIFVRARKKPEGWMGKNWACMEGFRKSSGELFLFTDSDTVHSKNVISLAVSHLFSEKLDVLTVSPRMRCLDGWTKITLPMISTFLHTRFSALRVNDPNKKTGYFFGSFFIIKKKVYESVGMHEGVKHEIIEDGALGKKVKESGFKMKMVRGDHLIDAVWARDVSSLWHAIKRLMVPLYLQNKGYAVGIFFAVLFLLFMPFPLLAYSGVFFNEGNSFVFLFIVSIISCILLYTAAFIETKILYLKYSNAVLCPIGSFIVVFGFLSGILQAKSNAAVSWRGRSYSMKEYVQDSIQV
ncbi:MAG TPA: glycosyltransferase [Nitrosopumilaceae archaeon]|nr:glycosyltransferase [Nitrosopumilaceae archaeon]